MYVCMKVTLYIQGYRAVPCNSDTVSSSLSLRRKISSRRISDIFSCPPARRILSFQFETASPRAGPAPLSV